MAKPITTTYNCIKTNNLEQGYIVLLSVIILTVTFLALLSGLATQAIQARQAALNRQLKTQSRQLAAACAAEASLKLALDPSYSGSEIIGVGNQHCQIKTILTDASHLSVTTSATIDRFPTTLKSVININDFSLVSQTEILTN